MKEAKFKKGGLTDGAGSEWDESQHPRDEDGKFSATSSSATGTDNRGDIPSPRGKNKTIEEFFCNEYKGFKGADAIEKLLLEKQGHIKGAFNRAELGGNGDIDLVWGDSTGGLDHLIKERDKDVSSGYGIISGIDMARKIPDIIENGEIVIDHKGRPGFEFDGCMVCIKPTFDGKKLNWVISAMEIKKPAGS